MKEIEFIIIGSNIFCGVKKYNNLYHNDYKCNYNGFIISETASFRFVL